VLPDRQLFEARAEYRPESESPMHVTLDPPERVLERRRLLDEAGLAQRVKWKVTGIPVKRIDGDNSDE